MFNAQIDSAVGTAVELERTVLFMLMRQGYVPEES